MTLGESFDRQPRSATAGQRGTNPLRGSNPEAGRIDTSSAPPVSDTEAPVTHDSHDDNVTPSKPAGPQTVRLRNGTRHDVKIAVATWETLKRVGDAYPDLFAAAVALAGGKRNRLQ